MSAERFERVNQLVHTIFSPKFHVVASEHNKRYKIKHHQADKDWCLNFYFDVFVKTIFMSTNKSSIVLLS